MQIVQAPNSVLSSKAKKITKIDGKIEEVIEEMKKTLLFASDPEGIGLAAPQIGLSLQLFIIKPEKDSPFSIFINPQVTLIYPPTKPDAKNMLKKKSKLEGCLSLKDIWGTVQRAPKVKVVYQDETGTTHTKTFSGFFATIIQHEQDHLDGILFPRRVLEQHGKLYKSHKNAEGHDEFDPLKI